MKKLFKAFVLSLSLLSLTGYMATAKNTNIDTSIQGKSSTKYGIFTMKSDLNTKLTAANNLGAEYVRTTVFLSRWNGTKDYAVDFWKANNKKVILNIDNDTTPSAFPKDLVAYESKLRSVLSVYAGSIEFVAIENEEMNDQAYQPTLYHLGSMQDYINELTVAARVCQEMGVPVVNGGLTNPIVPSLRHYYEVNGKKDSLNWLVQQMGTINVEPSLWMRTDSLLNAYKNLPLSYVNLHWYEPTKDTTRLTGILQVVCNYITQQTGKKVITNETGVKTSDSTVIRQLLEQWAATGTEYCVVFDGVDIYNAQLLTSPAGTPVANGIAYRDFITGKASCEKSITINPDSNIVACYNDKVKLTASSGFSNYLWSNGATTRSITVNATATENYSVTSDMGNCTAFSNSVSIKVNPLPAKPVISTNPSPVTDVCPSKSVTLISTGAMSYAWNTGDTTKTITMNKAGKYSVTVSDVNGCKNKSNTVKVTYQQPVAPINLRVTDITQNSATLNWDLPGCSVGYQLQYSEAGSQTWTSVQLVNGATASRTIYSLKPATTYQWRMLTYGKTTPDTLASAYASGQDFTTLTTQGISGNAQINSLGGDKIFPVPARDIATVTLSRVSDDLRITLVDLSGKVLWQSGKISGKTVVIPVSQLATGTYLVVIRDKEYSNTLKLFKQ